MTTKPLIYAVDDEKSIQEVYSYALESAGFLVECFSNSIELFSALEKKTPDLILLDVMLDGEDGFSILEKLRKNVPTKNVPCIMVSAKTQEIDKVKGLNSGADDYISKPFGIMELVARINAKLRTVIKSCFTYKDIVVNDEIRKVTVNDKNVTLTLKQYELLKLLVLNSEKVLKRDELLDAVWGENYGETRTLDIHIADLRKILCSSSAEIQTVRGIGYMLI